MLGVLCLFVTLAHERCATASLSPIWQTLAHARQLRQGCPEQRSEEAPGSELSPCLTPASFGSLHTGFNGPASHHGGLTAFLMRESIPAMRGAIPPGTPSLQARHLSRRHPSRHHPSRHAIPPGTPSLQAPSLQAPSLQARHPSRHAIPPGTRRRRSHWSALYCMWHRGLCRVGRQRSCCQGPNRLPPWRDGEHIYGGGDGGV